MSTTCQAYKYTNTIGRTEKVKSFSKIPELKNPSECSNGFTIRVWGKI